MKKNYIKPTVSIVRVALTNIIAQSIKSTNVGLGQGGDTNSNGITTGNAKSRGIWDDDTDKDGLW